MSRIILQPAGNAASAKHYEDTVATPVPVTKITKYLGPGDVEVLSQAAINGGIATWGVTPAINGSNVTKWNQIQRGDVVLFGGKGISFASAVIVHKARSEALAQELWGRDPNNQTWEYLFFLTELREQSIPKEVINRLAGYEPDNAWMGFNVVSEGKSNAVLAGIGLESSSYAPAVSREDFAAELKRLAASGTTDMFGTSIIRKEQGALRKWLFSKKSKEKCGLCEREFAIEFLVAAHIKKRSACSLEERLDFENVAMPLCKFGCDELFEKAYVVVKNGIVSAGDSMPKSGAAYDYAVPIFGKNCRYWTVSSKQLFDWHSGLKK